MTTLAPPLRDDAAPNLDALRDPWDDVLARTEHRSIRLLRYTAAATLAMAVLALVTALGIALALLAAQAGRGDNGVAPGPASERLTEREAGDAGMSDLLPAALTASSPSAAPSTPGRPLTGALVTLSTVLVLSITVLAIAFIKSAFTLRSTAPEPVEEGRVPGRASSDAPSSALPGAELLRAFSDALSTALKSLTSPTR